MSLGALAQLLGVKRHQAEDALHSERAARAVLSRRDLFAAGGALAAGAAFSFLRPVPELPPFLAAILDVHAEAMVQSAGLLARVVNVPFAIAHGETEQAFRERARSELRRLTLKFLHQ